MTVAAQLYNSLIGVHVPVAAERHHLAMDPGLRVVSWDSPMLKSKSVLCTTTSPLATNSNRAGEYALPKVCTYPTLCSRIFCCEDMEKKY